VRVLSAVARNMTDWVRDAALIVNRKVERVDADIYVAETISNPPTTAQVQAIADALAAVSARLK
jgi:hypothetical protein